MHPTTRHDSDKYVRGEAKPNRARRRQCQFRIIATATSHLWPSKSVVFTNTAL